MNPLSQWMKRRYLILTLKCRSEMGQLKKTVMVMKTERKTMRMAEMTVRIVRRKTGLRMCHYQSARLHFVVKNLNSDLEPQRRRTVMRPELLRPCQRSRALELQSMTQ